MRIYISLLLIVAFLGSCQKNDISQATGVTGTSEATEATETTETFDIKHVENRISIIWSSKDQSQVVSDFSFIPSYEKYLLSYFPDGSLLGYLPKYDPALIIQSWNDKNYDFLLFHINISTGQITILYEGKGWEFHIKDSDDSEEKWVIITPEDSFKILRIQQDGYYQNLVEIPYDLIPDYSNILKYEGNLVTIEFGNIEKEIIYEVNLENGNYEIIDQE